MIRLEVTIPGEDAYVTTFDRFPCAIGRSRKNDLLIRHVSVSGDHGYIYENAERIFLKDLESRNGIRLDGELQPEIELREGLEFAIGDVKCKVVSLTTPARAPETPIEVEAPPAKKYTAPLQLDEVVIDDAEAEPADYFFQTAMPGAAIVGALFFVLAILQISEGSLGLGDWIGADLQVIGYAVPITLLSILFSKFAYREFDLKKAIYSGVISAAILLLVLQLEEAIGFRIGSRIEHAETAVRVQLFLKAIASFIATWLFLRGLRPIIRPPSIFFFWALLAIVFGYYSVQQDLDTGKSQFQAPIPLVDGSEKDRMTPEQFIRKTDALFLRTAN